MPTPPAPDDSGSMHQPLLSATPEIAPENADAADTDVAEPSGSDFDDTAPCETEDEAEVVPDEADIEDSALVEVPTMETETIVSRAQPILALVHNGDGDGDIEDDSNETVGAPECRYCKESGRHPVTGGELIAPCKCTGSLQYVHAEPCLRLWLEARTPRHGMHGLNGITNAATPTCEICKQPYEIVYEKHLSWRTDNMCSLQSCYSYLELFGVAVMTACLVTTIVILCQDQSANELYEKITNYGVIGILTLILIFATAITVKKICWRWRRDNSVTLVRPVSRPGALGYIGHLLGSS